MIHSLPRSISQLVRADSLAKNEIGKSKSEVFRVQLTSGAPGFLKITSVPHTLEEMRREISVLRWLHSRIEVPELIRFDEEHGIGFLLTTALEGINLTEAGKGFPPSECMRLGASYLRKIHSISTASCSLKRELKTTMALAEKNLRAGLVDETDFDPARAGRTADEVYAELRKKVPTSEDLVFTHGDYCLPNIIFNGAKVTGVVDLSRAGVADRHQDIALFLRSFQSNTGTAPDIAQFLQYYGLVSRLDEAKLEFFRILDEFF